jgi:hypothetical protein
VVQAKVLEDDDGVADFGAVGLLVDGEGGDVAEDGEVVCGGEGTVAVDVAPG